MKLIYDKPTSQDAENVLKRVRQLAELRWTPARQFPTAYIFEDEFGQKSTQTTFTQAWLTQKGTPYSGVRIHEKFIGYNVSLETFMTALQNPNSVLYTRPQHKMMRGMSSYYGTVCAVFVSYAFDLPYRVPCTEWPDIPGIRKVDTENLDDLRLCDLLLKPGKHIALITAIGRDEAGHVREITVSEETEPNARVLTFSPEAFRGFWVDCPLGKFDVLRLPEIPHVTYTPTPYVHLEGDPELPVPEANKDFLPDFGDKFNCELGEEVSFTVFTDGWDEIAVTAPDGVITLPIKGGRASFTPKTPGKYSAVCRAAGRESAPVSWYVTAMELEAEKTFYAPGEPIRVTVRDPGGNEAFAYNISTEQFLSKKNGLFSAPTADGTLELPGMPEGSYRAFVVAKNEYGCYRSTRIGFTVR